MTCNLCTTKPVYKLPNKSLCKKCFVKYFEEKVFKTIRKFKLLELNDKLVCATSGGKDSITVLYLTHKYLKRKGLHGNLSALAIDEGIKDYRGHTLDFLSDFCSKLKVDLHIVSFKDKFGKTLDECVKILSDKKSNVSPCNICGTFRRSALNTGARELGATKLITGHNADDEAQSVLLNIFKNNYSILSRLGPFNGVVTDELFIPRIKPLYLMSEKEIRLYTILKGFDVSYDECPYAKGSFRGNIGDMINRLEDEHKGVKSSIVKFYLEIQDSLKDKYKKENDGKVTYCSVCKEPSQRKVCNTCEMKEFVKK